MSFVNHALSRNQILSSGLLLRRCVVFHRVFSPGFEPRLGAFCTGFTAQDLSGPLVPKALQGLLLQVQETARSPDSPGLMVREDMSSVGPSWPASERRIWHWTESGVGCKVAASQSQNKPAVDP